MPPETYFDENDQQPTKWYLYKDMIFVGAFGYDPFVAVERLEEALAQREADVNRLMDENSELRGKLNDEIGRAAEAHMNALDAKARENALAATVAMVRGKLRQAQNFIHKLTKSYGHRDAT